MRSTPRCVWRTDTIAHHTEALFALGAFGDGRPGLTVSTPLPELVDALASDHPQAILTAPSVAGMLAIEQLEAPTAGCPRLRGRDPPPAAAGAVRTAT